MRSRLSSVPLFWRVFGTNAVVLVLAFLGLVFAPVTVSVPPAAIEVVILTAGLLCLLAINLALLRPAFRPLDHLVDTMRRHDPLDPGTRVQVEGGPVVAALAHAFNDMLDRLESERRESGRRALLVPRCRHSRPHLANRRGSASSGAWTLRCLSLRSMSSSSTEWRRRHSRTWPGTPTRHRYS
jgi:HAMP domain-containing protein